MEKSDLSKKIKSLSQTSFDSFSNPFDDDISEVASVNIEVDNSSKNKVTIDDESGKKKKKKDKFARILDKGNSLIDKYSDDIISDFDLYLENKFNDDEDRDLRNSLIGMGRKYARETTVSAETSEIQKAFSASEKVLNRFLEEIEKDKDILQKDIDAMRMARTKNFKTLSELIEVKTQFHNTALSVVKEINSIKKTQLDLKYKSEKNKPEENSSDVVSGRAIQQLFGMGRSNILSTVGGYEGVSGAFTEDESPNESVGYDDDVIQQKYFNNADENDGDKFLRYENLGVEYVLILEPDGSKYIIAEDKDGNVVPDYPLPRNIDELNFDIDDRTKTATDDFHRNYKVRIDYSAEEDE